MTRLPAWFWPWAAWRDRGKTGTRPASAPAHIPAWFQARYLLHWAARRPAPPPPPRPRSPFETKSVLGTYGMMNGDLRAAALVVRAKQAGYTTVFGQFTLGNEVWLADLHDCCHVAELTFGLWDATPSPQRVRVLADYKPALVMLESEGTVTDWAGIVSALEQTLPCAPRAVITNMSGLDDAVLQAAGFVLMPECYQQDNPNATPANLDRDARARGYQVVVPCVGVYHNYPLAGYLPLDSFCVYAAEYMSDADWAA